MIPIKTIIRNKTNISKTIHWAGKDTHWLQANGETVVPFEIWSVANDAQQNAIKYALATGSVELTLMVLNDKGEYAVIPFNPIGKAAVQQNVQPGVVNIDTTKEKVAALDHTVRVASKETASVMQAYGAKPMPVGTDEVLPVRELKNGDPEPVAEQPAEPVQDEATVKQEGEEVAADEQPVETKKRRKKAE